MRMKWVTRLSSAMIVGTALLLASCGISPAQKSTSAEDLPVLTIGSPMFAPYFYMGQDGYYTGADKEIAEEACRRIGYKAEFKEILWGEKDTLLNSRDIDCIWGCFVMDGREECYQWAGPYLTSEEAVLVPADSDIFSLADLEGKTVAVRVGSKAEDFFLGELDEFGETAPAVSALSTFNSMKEAFVWFGKGYADAVADHRAALENLIAYAPQLYRFLDENFFTAKLGVAFRTDFDSSVVNALTEALNKMKEDGTISSIATNYGVAFDGTGEEADNERETQESEE